MLGRTLFVLMAAVIVRAAVTAGGLSRPISSIDLSVTALLDFRTWMPLAIRVGRPSSVTLHFPQLTYGEEGRPT
jgi:hypothetical protein